MVNKLSVLADFLDNDSLPLWIKQVVREKKDEISAALDKNQSYELSGPNGEKVTIEKEQAAVA